MRNKPQWWFAAVAALLLALGGAGNAMCQGTVAYEQILPGVACTDQWATALYIMVDPSGGGVPRYEFNAFYIPATDNDLRYEIFFDLADLESNTYYTMRDFICEYFPQAVSDSGTVVLTSDTPFYAWHQSWHRVLKYGSAVQPATAFLQGWTYSWFGDTMNDGTYRFNLFVYNNDTEPAFVWVGNELLALEPWETERISGVNSVGHIEMYLGEHVYGIVSQVNNETNDAVAVPLILRELF